MQLLDNLTDAADQFMIFPLLDGSLVQLEFFYRSGIERWSVDIIHPTIPGGAIHGFTICQGPNILRQWRNLIPFGMCVISGDGLDPTQSTDFLNGVCQIFMLDAIEVAQVEEEILSPIPLVNP